jgi:hypothetical protein
MFKKKKKEKWLKHFDPLPLILSSPFASSPFMIPSKHWVKDKGRWLQLMSI